MSTAIPTVFGLKDLQRKKEKVRRCKIIGTIGPSSCSPEIIDALVRAGLDIARLNFSHGEPEFHLRNIENIRAAAKRNGRCVTILQDLQGPKIRCGKLLGDQMELRVGASYFLEYGTVQSDPNSIPIDYKDILADVKVGEKVMMDDGLLQCTICEKTATQLRVEVSAGGVLRNRKGVNFPLSKLRVPTLTEKDNRDLIFGITSKVDAIALSFVQNPQDVRQCQNIIKAMGADIPVIAKIERLSAVQLIGEIAEAADGLMVARGDLGVEAGIENVPSFQRRIIKAASDHAKPVIIATQMLESMTHNPRASLAEVADVANGVLEGADCVMLSGEVASGNYPVECVERMVSIIKHVEDWRLKRDPRYQRIADDHMRVWSKHKAIARAACEAADCLNAKVIVCLSLTGSIAASIAKWRPKTPIMTISPRVDVIQRLGLIWGVYGMVNPLFYNTDILLQDLPNLLKSLGIVKSGDFIVITAGIPLASMSPTNMLKINKIA